MKKERRYDRMYYSLWVRCYLHKWDEGQTTVQTTLHKLHPRVFGLSGDMRLSDADIPLCVCVWDLKRISDMSDPMFSHKGILCVRDKKGKTLSVLKKRKGPVVGYAMGWTSPQLKPPKRSTSPLFTFQSGVLFQAAQEHKIERQGVGRRDVNIATILLQKLDCVSLPISNRSRAHPEIRECHIKGSQISAKLHV